MTRTLSLLNARDLVIGFDEAERVVVAVAAGELESDRLERILAGHLQVL